MLFELLTGERPYRPARDSRAALEEAIVNVEPAGPKQRRHRQALGACSAR